MKNLKNTTSNIFAVIRSDFGRLSKSIVAIACVFGLALIPCLYAWFNIDSNWDPYTEDSTKNIKIAVFSEDEGSTLLGVNFCVGNIILDKLHANDQIDWQFPESKQDMLDGLYAGDYYAALLVPEEFSSKVLGFADGDVEKANIIYYDNQKKNAVATRITDRAKGIIEDEINSIFVATLVDEVSSFTSVFQGIGVEADTALEDLAERLSEVKQDLRTYDAILVSMAAVTESAASVTQMTNDLLPDIIELLVNSRKSIADMKDRLATSKEDVIYAADAIRNSSEELRNTVERLDGKVDGDPAEAGSSYVDWDALFGEGGINQYEGEILDDLYSDVNKQLHESVIAFDDILQQTNIDSNLIASMTTLQDSLSNLDSLIVKVQDDVNAQSMTLSQYTSALAACTDSINGTRDVMSYMLSTVGTIQETINDLRTSDSFTKIIDMLRDNVDELVDYLGDPTNVETVRLYALDHFGSGMAPYYTMLSLYASALLSVSLMSTHIKRREEFPSLSDSSEYFGRLFIFFAIGQLTALITALGNLYFLGIQCYSPFQFWFAAALASLVCVLINYSLVFAFGNIGEALSIIILVIQVAGSGGTYPLEMLPKFFQNLYKVMPFNYAMTAMRETIAGSYDHTYIKCILVLLLMALIMIPIGIFGRKLFRPAYNYFESSKKKTNLMHTN